jgi:AraC family transcriptional regulator
MPLSFAPGEFYGALARGVRGGPFAVKALAASAREEEVAVQTHEDAHFVFVLSGVYISTARGAPELARAPFLVFNPPGVTHRDRFVAGVGAFVAVSLSQRTFAETAGLEPLRDFPTAVPGADALAHAWRIAREVRGPGRDAAILEASGWALIAATASGETGPEAPAWAHRAYEAVMDEAFDPNLTVARIAALAGVHPVHLARVFRSVWGCTPGDLLRCRRVQRASDLLRSTRLGAAEIAAAAGFSDQAHMTRAFRALHGLTPGQWRRAHDVAPIQDQTRGAA